MSAACRHAGSWLYGVLQAAGLLFFASPATGSRPSERGTGASPGRFPEMEPYAFAHPNRQRFNRDEIERIRRVFSSPSRWILTAAMYASS